MKKAVLIIGVIWLTISCSALTNPNFDTGGSGWATYSPSNSVSFSGGQVHLNKVPTDGIAVYQNETAFTSAPYRAVFVVTAVTGSFGIGWQNPASVWATGSPVVVTAPGTFTIDCLDPSFKVVNAGELDVSTQFTASIDSINTMPVPVNSVEDWQIFQ